MATSWKVGIWKEGKHLDLWHINHFLSGVLLGGLTIMFDLNLWLGFLISLILIIAWEVIEIVSGIKETRFNMYLDIVLAVIAFFLVTILNNNYLSESGFENLFYICLLVFSILELWGFWAYKKREKSKK